MLFPTGSSKLLLIGEYLMGWLYHWWPLSILSLKIPAERGLHITSIYYIILIYIAYLYCFEWILPWSLYIYVLSRFSRYICISCIYIKIRDLTQSYDKITSVNWKLKKQIDSTKTPSKCRLHEAIADRLGTVNWTNDNHGSGVVKAVFWILTFPLTTKAVWSNGHTFKSLLITLFMKTKDQQATKR